MSDHNIFYIPPRFFCTDQVTIEGPHLRHIRNVLRKKIGEPIILTDGQGYHYLAELRDARSRRMTAKILQKRLMPRKFSLGITLGFVPIKGLRNDLIIEKGTELGVSGFIVFSSEHAVVRNIGDQKIKRWNKIAQSAMTQSQQYYLPEVLYLPDLSDILQNFRCHDSILVADPNGIRTTPRAARKMLLLIGPEGGFSGSEKDLLVESGAVLVSLGQSRLRSETAAIVGVSKILTAYGLL
jgi:16S rRNA (uracil1498-N3)-methyltransferase